MKRFETAAAVMLMVVPAACQRDKAVEHAGQAGVAVVQSAAAQVDTVAVPAANLDALPGAAIPSVMENACEGEGCEASYQAVACRDFRLVESPKQRQPTVLVHRGDTLAIRTDLHIGRPGVVVVRRAYVADITRADGSGARLALARGDTLLLVTYIGEGYWNARFKGHALEIQEFWGGESQREFGMNDSVQALDAIAVNQPEIETWLRVSRGTAGPVMGWLLEEEASPIAPIGEAAEKWGTSCPSDSR